MLVRLSLFKAKWVTWVLAFVLFTFWLNYLEPGNMLLCVTHLQVIHHLRKLFGVLFCFIIHLYHHIYHISILSISGLVPTSIEVMLGLTQIIVYFKVFLVILMYITIKNNLKWNRNETRVSLLTLTVCLLLDHWEDQTNFEGVGSSW